MVNTRMDLKFKQLEKDVMNIVDGLHEGLTKPVKH